MKNACQISLQFCDWKHLKTIPCAWFSPCVWFSPDRLLEKGRPPYTAVARGSKAIHASLAIHIFEGKTLHAFAQCTVDADALVKSARLCPLTTRDLLCPFTTCDLFSIFFWGLGTKIYFAERQDPWTQP